MIEQIGELIRSLFPDLTVGKTSVLGEGWDSIAIEVNDSLVVRIPKRPLVAQQMAKEVRVLEAIRPYLSVQVPQIEWISRGHGGIAVSAMGYRKLVGTPLCEIPPGSMRNHALLALGRFLTELHAIPTCVVKQAGVPWFRWTGDDRVNGPESWEEGLRRFTNQILKDGVPRVSCSVAEAVTEAIEAHMKSRNSFQFEPVLIHGDLAPEHILVDTETGEIGIIDFGDCGIGDAAYDVWPELTPFYDGIMDASFHARQGFYRKLSSFHGVLHQVH